MYTCDALDCVNMAAQIANIRLLEASAVHLLRSVTVAKEALLTTLCENYERKDLFSQLLA